MVDFLLGALPFFGTYTTVAGSILWLFVYLEKRLSSEFVENIALWLIDDAKSISLTSQINNVLDFVFGRKLFSVRVFFASFIISSVSLFVIASIYVWLSDGSDKLSYTEIVTERFGSIISLFILGFVVNQFTDISSLIQTRFFIRFLEKRNSIFLIMLIVIIDIIATLAIYVIFYLFLFHMFLMLGIFIFQDEQMEGFVSYIFYPETAIVSLIFSIMYSSYFIPSVLTTYTTSVFLWVYFLSAIFGRLVLRFRYFSKFLFLFISHDFVMSRPLTFIGEVLSVVIFIFTLIIYFLLA